MSIWYLEILICFFLSCNHLLNLDFIYWWSCWLQMKMVTFPLILLLLTRLSWVRLQGPLERCFQRCGAHFGVVFPAVWGALWSGVSSGVGRTLEWCFQRCGVHFGCMASCDNSSSRFSTLRMTMAIGVYLVKELLSSCYFAKFLVFRKPWRIVEFYPFCIY